MLIEKVQPYIQNIDNNVLPGPILQPQMSSDKKVSLVFLVLFTLSRISMYSNLLCRILQIELYY